MVQTHGWQFLIIGARYATGTLVNIFKITGNLRKNFLVFSNFSWFLHNFTLFPSNFAGILLIFTLLFFKFSIGIFITAWKGTGKIRIFWKNCHPCWFSEENDWKSCICCSLELLLLDMKHRGMCWKVIMAGEVLVLFCLVLGVENDWKSYVHDVSLWIMLVQSTYVIYEIVLTFRKASMRSLLDPWWRDGGHSLTSRERTRSRGTVFK